MTVFFDKARARWRYDFQKHGERFQGYADHPDSAARARSRRDAAAAEALIKARVDRNAPRPAAAAGEAMTLARAFANLVATLKDGAHTTNRKAQMSELLGWFGAEASAGECAARAWEYVAWSRKRPVRVYAGGSRKAADVKKRALWRKAAERTRSDSTINRYLDCLRRAWQLAHDTRDPATGRRLVAELPDIPKLPEPEHLPRPIADDALARIIAHAPPHLADAAALTVHMGFRKAEVFALELGWLSADPPGVWLPAERTKAQRAEFVPANATAWSILERLAADARKHNVKHLIRYRRPRAADAPNGKPAKPDPGRPIKSARTAWRNALKAAGVTHRWHDTKASFVTAVASVASAEITQRLARHKDYKTTQRYLAVADADKRAAVDAIAGRTATAAIAGNTAIAGKTPSQESLTAKPARPAKSAKYRKSLVGAAGFEPATPSPPD